MKKAKSVSGSSIINVCIVNQRVKMYTAFNTPVIIRNMVSKSKRNHDAALNSDRNALVPKP